MNLKEKESKKKDQIKKERGFVVSIQRDRSKTEAQAQCCKPGPCSPKW